MYICIYMYMHYLHYVYDIFVEYVYYTYMLYILYIHTLYIYISTLYSVCHDHAMRPTAILMNCTCACYSDVLNGVITGDKVHRSMKRLGNCRLQMWNIIIAHLKALVEKSGGSAEELSR